jgi:hypothetical protein
MTTARTAADSSTSPKWKRSAEVVHGVEAPEQRDHVIGAVPPIDPEIKQHEIENKAGHAAPPQRPPRKGVPHRPYGERRDDERRERAVGEPQRGIPREALPRAADLGAPPIVGRSQAFGREDHRQPKQDDRPLPAQGGVERGDLAGRLHRQR